MFQKYRRKNIAEMKPWQKGMDMNGVSISEADKENGSPLPGDLIARNPKNHADKWLVAKEYAEENFELIE